MRLRWGSLERGEASQGELGVYTGAIEEGTWGVSTLTVNPVTHSPYVRLFEDEGEALAYARRRVASGPPLYYPRRPGERQPERNPNAKVYYVVQMPLRDYDSETGERAMYPRYRVLRGQRRGVDPLHGERDPRRDYPPESKGTILVFDYAGTVETRVGPRDRWKLNQGQSVDVIDIEAETERRRRGQHRK